MHALSVSSLLLHFILFNAYKSPFLSSTKSIVPKPLFNNEFLMSFYENIEKIPIGYAFNNIIFCFMYKHTIFSTLTSHIDYLNEVIKSKK